jgi:hypothetical protein
MISKPLQLLVSSFSNNPIRNDWSSEEGPRFTTNKITISVGSFYERMRYAVDYQEEHMLRRAAIERIIRRLVLFTSMEGCGRTVLEEMVRARYIENDSVPEKYSDDIQDILDKYRFLISLTEDDEDVLWSFAAVEIERHLFPAEIDERTFTAIFQSVVEYFKPKEQNVMSNADFNLRVYVACRRVFLRESHAALNFSLFRIMVPDWQLSITQSEQTLRDIATRFAKIQSEANLLMNDPVHWKINTQLKNESIFFALINEVARKYGTASDAILENFEKLKEMVTPFLDNTYEAHKIKITQSGTRAVIYVLITKIIIGLSIELPYEIFILGEINYYALAINILFFPILLIVMTKTVTYPNEANTEEVLRNLHAFIQGNYPQTRYISMKVRTPLQKFTNLVFTLVFFSISFSVIVYALQLVHFNPVSIGLFLFFLCIVTYMGLRIRHKSREWTYEHEDESLGGLLWFLLVVPITRTGRYISEKLSNVNIFVFIMDFVLETPFKIILGSFDSFISYVREARRDGV